MRWIIFSFFYFMLVLSHAQNYRTTSYGAEQGLIQGSVYCINQDEKGLIWISTDQGLYRFDGNQFKHFGNDEGINDNEVFGIVGDSNDFFFLGTFKGGINYYSKGQIYNSFNDTFLRQIRINGTPNILQITNYKYVIWGYGDSHFYIFHVESGQIIKVKRITITKKLQLLTATQLPNREVKFLIASYSEKVFWGNLDTGMNLTITPNPNALLVSKTGYLKEENHAFVYFDFNNEPLFQLKKEFGRPQACFDIGNHIWFTSRNGVMLYEKGKYVETFFKEHATNHVFEDRDGNVWIGTEGAGLKLLSKHQIKNIEFKQKNLQPMVLKYIGRDSVIIGFDKLSYGIYTPDQGLSLHNLVDNGQFINQRIRDVVIHDKNNITIASDHCIFTGSMTDLFNPTKGLKSLDSAIINYSGLKCLDHDKSQLWIGSSGGLYRKKKESQIFDRIRSGRVTAISLDKSNNIWIGCNPGLTVLKAPQQKNKVKITGELQQRRINHMAWFKDTLFLATDSGVFSYHNKTTKFIAGISTGLPSNNCTKVKINASGIWVATPRGLCNLKPHQGFYKTTIYTISDGLLSNHINDILLKDNQVYVIGSKGLSYFNPSHLKKHKPPAVNILSLSTKDSSFNCFAPIILKKGTQSLSIHFAAVSYGKTCGYTYRLQRHADQWSNTKENKVSFTNLEPGEYIFEVFAMNNDGVRSRQKATLSFEINAFYYQTVWFNLILILLTLLVISYGLYWRYSKIIDRERKKNNLENEYALLELEAIKAQINPHFIYNCLNSIQHSIIKHDNENAEKQLSTFAKLVRETLDYSKTSFITLEQEMLYLEKYLSMEKHRFKDKIEFQVITSVDHTPSIRIPSLLIQPYVENAVKYGQSEDSNSLKIRVCFTQHQDRLICKIEDSGSGMKKSKTKFSQTPSGLSLSLKRAETYNTIYKSDIKIKIINKTMMESYSQGTMVLISFPLKQL